MVFLFFFYIINLLQYHVMQHILFQFFLSILNSFQSVPGFIFSTFSCWSFSFLKSIILCHSQSNDSSLQYTWSDQTSLFLVISQYLDLGINYLILYIYRFFIFLYLCLYTAHYFSHYLPFYYQYLHSIFSSICRSAHVSDSNVTTDCYYKDPIIFGSPVYWNYCRSHQTLRVQNHV